MFKKTQRLSTSEFQQFFRTGKKHHSSHLTIISSKHDSLKVAVVVGKKVARSAVTRNRLKRRVAATLRDILAHHTGVYIAILKPPFATLPRKTATTTLKETFAPLLKTK
jgi:ribonuclease P protein component